MRPGPKPEKDELIIELRRQGYSMDETAHRAGVSSSTVSNCIRRHGLVGRYRVQPPQNKPKAPVRKPARKPKYDEQILALRREGLTVRRISARLDISQKTVCACLKRHGLAKKTKPAEHRQYAPRRQPFSLIILGGAGIKVLPTSEAQYERLLEALQELGGEVI